MEFNGRALNEMAIHIKAVKEVDAGNQVIDTDTLAQELDTRTEYEADSILAEQLTETSPGHYRHEYLIKWWGFNVLESTWEPTNKFKWDHPLLDTWTTQKVLQNQGRAERFPLDLFQSKAKIYNDRKSEKRQAMLTEAREPAGDRRDPSRDTRPPHQPHSDDRQLGEGRSQHSVLANREDELAINPSELYSTEHSGNDSLPPVMSRSVKQEASTDIIRGPPNSRHPYSNSFADVNHFFQKIDGTTCDKVAFMWFDDDEDVIQGNALLEKLQSNHVYVYPPGRSSWADFVNECSSGIVLFGPRFWQFETLTGLPKKIEQGFNFFEFRRWISEDGFPGHPTKQIFQENCAVFFSDEAIQDDPSYTLQALRNLEERINIRGPQSTRILSRPGFLTWLERCAQRADPRGETWTLRRDMFLLVQSIMWSDPSYFTIEDGELLPTDKCPVYFQPERFLQSQLSWRDEKEVSIAWFSRWSVEARFGFKKFTVITTARKEHIASWTRTFPLLEFTTPERFLAKEE